MPSNIKALPRILLIEDDRYIAGALLHTLKNSYDIEHVGGGRQALYKTESTAYDIVLLDLNLPDINGLAVCRKLRSRGVLAPIFILSGENKVLTKITLLDSGANDFLAKPFTVGELKARIRALLRNKHVQPYWPEPLLQCGGVTLDRKKYSVTHKGQQISLRKKEFDLLACLMENAGRVVHRQELITKVWQGSEDPWTNTLDVHIKYLRDKFDKPFNTHFIRTVHGRGYIFEADNLMQE